MSPLPPDRLHELRDIAKALGDGRRRDSRRSSRRRWLGFAIVAVGIVFAWRFTTPCGLRSCEERYAIHLPDTIAVAQAPMPANDDAAESVTAEPAPEVVPEPAPTVNLNERLATNEIGTLLAAERDARALGEPRRVPEAAPPPVATVRTKEAAPPRPRVAAAATPRPALRKRPSATPVAALPIPAEPVAAEPLAVVAAEPHETETPTPSTLPEPVPEIATGPEVAPDRGPNLSGRWLLTNAIDATTHSAFAGLRIRFRVQLEQHGESITGRGEKYTVDDEPLPASQRSPIVLEGTVRGRDVLVRFLERGTRRVSSGGFRWRISADGKSLQGTFESSAAGTRGRSHATRDG